MEDSEIISLYNARSESAIAETDSKYGRLCREVAGSILRLPEDAEEAVQDTYLGAWNAIPPASPRSLRSFLCAIARRLSLKKYDYINAGRRHPDCVMSLSELSDCVSGSESPESELENRRVEAVISGFVRALPQDKRFVFLRRYWYFDSIARIAGKTGYSESKVTSMLFHLRMKLRETLEKESVDTFS